MSEKYSTEGLIDALNRKTRGYGFADIQENEIDAIIAKLRAGDIMEAKLKVLEKKENEKRK